MFHNQLRILRKKKGLTLDEFAEQYNRQFEGSLNKGTLSKYENGRQWPKINIIMNIASFFDVTIDYLLGVDNKTSSVKVPIYSKISSGLPSDTQTGNIIGYEDIPGQLAETGDFFALMIADDSMSPVIKKGDIAIIRRQGNAANNDIVIAKTSYDKISIRKYLTLDKSTLLLPFNHEYNPSVFYSSSNCITILGKVIESRTRF